MEALNTRLFLLLNAPSGLHGVSLWIVTALAEWMVWLIPIGLTSLWLLGELNDQRAAVKALLAGVLVLGLNQLIGLAWFHPRPFMLGIGHSYLAHAADSSFPSDHVSLLCAVGLALWTSHSLWAKRLAGLLLVVTPLVAWARIYLGVHFPLDMLGALAAAGAVVWLLNTFKGQQLSRKLADSIDAGFAIIFGQKSS
jgi:undecaprenyl-diphosphatase